MKQITEDYVSYEIAALLKEKGFDIPCDSYYIYFDSSVTLYEGYVPSFSYGNINHNKFSSRTSRPSQSLALKWLREVHNIFVEISADEMLADKGYQWALFYNDTKVIMPYAGWGNTYEEAVEAALDYVLKNLI